MWGFCRKEPAPVDRSWASPRLPSSPSFEARCQANNSHLSQIWDSRAVVLKLKRGCTVRYVVRQHNHRCLCYSRLLAGCSVFFRAGCPHPFTHVRRCARVMLYSIASCYLLVLFSSSCSLLRVLPHVCSVARRVAHRLLCSLLLLAPGCLCSCAHIINCTSTFMFMYYKMSHPSYALVCPCSPSVSLCLLKPLERGSSQ